MDTIAEMLTAPKTQGQCMTCGAPVEVPDSPLARFGTYCDACFDRQARVDIAPLLEACEGRRTIRTVRPWESICPPAMLATEAHKLPKPSLLQRVMLWQFGPQGLLLHGETGTGKSRCLWKLAEREHKAGRSVVAVDAFDLGTTYPAKFTVSAAAAEQFGLRLASTDILLLDDPFKTRLTPAVEELIFTVIDRRMNHQLPILISANDTSDTLKARLTPDRAEPLIRRLLESCVRICAAKNRESKL